MEKQLLFVLEQFEAFVITYTLEQYNDGSVCICETIKTKKSTYNNKDKAKKDFENLKELLQK